MQWKRSVVKTMYVVYLCFMFFPRYAWQAGMCVCPSVGMKLSPVETLDEFLKKSGIGEIHENLPRLCLNACL
jgi:hypothetical protein